ncbi:MAG: hypothetical protein OYK82_09175 [Gammaproteobacteria bacterium]|nr:hypothetical protein [Gammaproteobacteria bacterium]
MPPKKNTTTGSRSRKNRTTSKKSAEERRKEAAARRFSEPVIVNPANLTPQQRERLELQNEAFRRAIYLNDFSLGRQLGLFPPLEDEATTDTT